MTFRQVVTDFKFWLVTVVAILGGLTALGATVDRPAWKSEVSAIEYRVAGNERAFVQMQIDQLLQSIWAMEDRYAKSPNPDLRIRIRQAKAALMRLEGRMRQLRTGG